MMILYDVTWYDIIWWMTWHLYNCLRTCTKYPMAFMCSCTYVLLTQALPKRIIIIVTRTLSHKNIHLFLQTEKIKYVTQFIKTIMLKLFMCFKPNSFLNCITFLFSHKTTNLWIYNVFHLNKCVVEFF